MARLLAFDLDGTLLLDDKTLPEATVSALSRLRARGCRIALITGRDRVPPEVERAVQPDALATNNGGTLVVNGEAHTEVRFSEADLRAVLAVALPGSHLLAYGRDRLYFDPPEGETPPAWTAERQVAPLREAAADEIFKVGFYHPEVAGWAERLRGSHPHLTLTGAQDPYPHFLTVTPKGADKGAALVALAEALAVPLADTVAFGDSDNDVAMLELAGLAVQVGDLPLLAPHADAQIEGPEALGAWLDQFAAGLAPSLTAPA